MSRFKVYISSVVDYKNIYKFVYQPKLNNMTVAGVIGIALVIGLIAFLLKLSVVAIIVLVVLALIGGTIYISKNPA